MSMYQKLLSKNLLSVPKPAQGRGILMSEFPFSRMSLYLSTASVQLFKLFCLYRLKPNQNTYYSSIDIFFVSDEYHILTLNLIPNWVI